MKSYRICERCNGSGEGSHETVRCELCHGDGELEEETCSRCCKNIDGEKVYDGDVCADCYEELSEL
jgi:DnaJ-class molecular chaperone